MFVTRPGRFFHKGKLVKKEKRTKKEKEQPVENAAAMEIRESIGRLRHHFLEADSHSCWKSLAQWLGFSTFTTGPAAIHQYRIKRHP
jgi:hypothetical protein